jgi:hypothetical protein
MSSSTLSLIRRRGSLSCCWVETGIPSHPLACKWLANELQTGVGPDVRKSFLPL